MFRRKKLVLIFITFLGVFFTTNYLFLSLHLKNSEVRKNVSIEEKIYQELKNLPSQYRTIPTTETASNIFDNFLKYGKQHDVKLSEIVFSELWAEVNSWTSSEKVLVNYTSINVGKALFALKNAAIVRADVDTRGTQLKLLLTLMGDQKVIFKPQWYPKNKIIEGPVYAGKDRYHSEIIGFYLSIILNRPLTPLSVERRISLKFDILPVATKRLLNTSFQRNNVTCVYGQCYYCKKSDPICENQEHFLNGAVIFNFKGSLKKYKSPWQRTYSTKRKAVWEQVPDNYCKAVSNKLSRKHIYDLIDTSIFDFFIQNGDRHHYEMFGDNIVWLDNGKGLGNPNVHHIDILAPLYQCCTIRKEMLRSLMNLTGGRLREKLKQMPDIDSLLTEAHLNAIEERLNIIFATLEYCKKIKRDNYQHYLL